MEITIATTTTIATTATTTITPTQLKLVPTVSPATTQPTHPEYYNKSTPNGNQSNSTQSQS